MEVRLQRALLTKVVDSRRNVMPDLGQQLLRSESWIYVKHTIDELGKNAF